MTSSYIEVGDAIRRARKAKDLSAGVLGQMLTPPVTHTAVCKWETGKTEPGINHLVQVCDILDLDPSSFLSTDRSDKPSELDEYMSRMNEFQRSAVLHVARAMVDC